MARAYRNISADSHLEVSPNRWRDRVPAQFRDLQFVTQNFVDGLHELFGRAAGQYFLFLFEGEVGEIGDAVHLGDRVVDRTDEPLVDLIAVIGFV